MICLVTHIDAAGHRRKARVTGSSVDNCLDQMEAAFGLPRKLSFRRFDRRPSLVEAPRRAAADRGTPCVH